jgi:hypothetical protein
MPRARNAQPARRQQLTRGDGVETARGGVTRPTTLDQREFIERGRRFTDHIFGIGTVPTIRSDLQVASQSFHAADGQVNCPTRLLGEAISALIAPPGRIRPPAAGGTPVAMMPAARSIAAASATFHRQRDHASGSGRAMPAIALSTEPRLHENGIVTQRRS